MKKTIGVFRFHVRHPFSGGAEAMKKAHAPGGRMGLGTRMRLSILPVSSVARLPVSHAGDRGSVALRRRISPGLPLSEYGWGQIR